MGGDAGGDFGPFYQLFDQLPDADPGESPAEAVEEDFPAGGFGGSLIEARSDGFAGEPANRDQPLFISFAGDPDEAGFEFDIRRRQIDQL